MSLFQRLFTALRTGAITDQEWDEIRANLIAADLGVKLVDQVILTAKSVKVEDAKTAISQVILTWLSKKDRTLITEANTLKTILIVGVNGTGKTTSVAKLAASLKSSGNSVILGAADTFRAAGVAQLQTWGERISVEVVSGKEGAEPAAVAFDSAKRASDEKCDYLIIDTAGRLHNKNDLMAELGKVKRVVEKVLPITEVLLVIDGTTGQNGLAQAKIFSEAVEVTGLIVTKLDGSARGGVALAIESALDIPIKFIGKGEGQGDFAAFEPDSYIDGLLA
jgi:fused signal recognition particle receptor